MIDCSIVIFCYLGRGNRRAIVIEDRNPFGRTPQVYFTRGLLCGWTPHGLCFSPDDRKDIHDFYVIPFENVGRDVYCDQVPNLSSGWGFGVNSVVLAKFRAASDKSEFWQAYVTTYWISGRGRVLRLKARTAFLQFGVNQIEETFLPNQVWLQGNQIFFCFVLFLVFPQYTGNAIAHIPVFSRVFHVGSDRETIDTAKDERCLPCSQTFPQKIRLESK